MSTKSLLLCGALSFAALVVNSKATLAEVDASVRAPADANSTTVESTYDTFISNSDLLTGATITSTISGPTDVGFPLTGINDGSASVYDGSNAGTTVGAPSHDAFFGASSGVQPGGSLGTTLDSSPTVKFTLNTSINTNGYTLTSFNSIYGWLDRPPFSDQDYVLKYSTVSAPSTFITLASVNYHPFSPSGTDNGNTGGGGSSASMVSLTGLGVSNVGAIEIQFLPYNNGTNTQAGQLVREMDLFGTPTLVPEPSTYALMGLGLLGLVAVRRFKQLA